VPKLFNGNGIVPGYNDVWPGRAVCLGVLVWATTASCNEVYVMWACVFSVTRLPHKQRCDMWGCVRRGLTVSRWAEGLTDRKETHLRHGILTVRCSVALSCCIAIDLRSMREEQ
jgi:hypothetical protein